jgi:uncharacterized protein
MPRPLDAVQTALVTGASSGIGQAFACQLAALGKDLVLVARREERLAHLAGELTEQHGIRAHVLGADLARPAAAAALLARTERLGLEVDLLINNAGFARGGSFADLPFDAQADMVRLNANTLVELTWLYLPGMRRRRRGGVINVASTAAFQPVPYMAVYGATKAFVLSFSHALAEELAGEGLAVMAFCPGATATDFWAVAGVEGLPLGLMPTADRVVARALRAFQRRRRVFVPGLGFSLLGFFSGRLMPPGLVVRLAGALLRARR